ncbi:MAG: hypothetical protein A3J97_15440 [Spirochaetes bacterium RIFOXYC1_FULL_54_7]|nr:MAG: hypothetical protein A3J97_15440 [Spirochaetes bacterium RIFOXYC1_FULL_54_7]
MQAPNSRNAAKNVIHANGLERSLTRVDLLSPIESTPSSIMFAPSPITSASLIAFMEPLENSVRGFIHLTVVQKYRLRSWCKIRDASDPRASEAK